MRRQVILYIEDVDLNMDNFAKEFLTRLVILYIEDVDLNERRRSLSGN